MRYTVTRTDGTPIPEDEPCLVIRAQDVFAPRVLKFYLELTDELIPDEITAELWGHYHVLMEWRMTNPDRIKVPDR